MPECEATVAYSSVLKINDSFILVLQYFGFQLPEVLIKNFFVYISLKNNFL